MLTYMSIEGQINRLVGKELFRLGSRLCGFDTPRTLFVSRTVLDAVNPPFAQATRRLRQLHAEFRATLDGFLEFGEISVGEDPDTKDSDALLARVHPVSDEFWDFRITAPHPQIRAFGGFVKKNKFVLLTWDYRDSIGDEFDAAVDECRSEWRRLFGSQPPFRGGRLDDYLSNYIPV